MYLEPDFHDAFFLGGEEAGNGRMQRPCFGPEDSVIGGERAMGFAVVSVRLGRCVTDLSAAISELYLCADRRDVPMPGGATAGPSEPGGVDDPTAEL
jgi:hypothetical protein